MKQKNNKNKRGELTKRQRVEIRKVVPATLDDVVADLVKGAAIHYVMYDIPEQETFNKPRRKIKP